MSPKYNSPDIGPSIEEEIESGDFNPSPEEYSPTENFMRARKNHLDGIFKGDVIKACFNGIPELVENHKYEQQFDDDSLSDGPIDYPRYLVMMVGEISECYFGLLLDPDNKQVITGHVLQANPVQAMRATEGDTNSVRLWESDAVKRMAKLAKSHEGEVFNAYIDPHEGNQERWIDDRKHDHPNKRYNISEKAQRKL